MHLYKRILINKDDRFCQAEFHSQGQDLAINLNASFFIPLFIIMFRNTEMWHKRVYGCRKKYLNTGRFFDNHDISLSFRYIDSNEKLENANELKIILGDQGLYLDNVPFKKISDFEIKNEFSFSTVKMRQIGLEFGELTSGQKMRLGRFIQYHTINED